MTFKTPPRPCASPKPTLPSRRVHMDGNREIPIDEDYKDASSEISAFDEISRTSLASSITQYRYENGRRYHSYRDGKHIHYPQLRLRRLKSKIGQYWAPNDDQSSIVDTIAHHIFLLTFDDKLFLTPLHNPRRALDIGCGNGIWALDFAERYPETEVIGTDLSPIQSPVAPANLRFEIDDCCSAWVYPENYFDYIHIRMLFASVADWPTLYRECYTHLAPGGYLEHAETTPITKSDDNSIAPGSMWENQGNLAMAAGEKFGKTFVQIIHMKDQITAAGFVDVTEVRFKWPVGPWSNDQKLKDLGRWNMHMWEQGLEGWTLALLTRVMRWSYDQVKDWLQRMRVTLLDRRLHVYQEMRVVFARKPLSSSTSAGTQR